MKITLQTESVDGTLNNRHFCEIARGDEVKLRREGDNPKQAALRALDALRFAATDAENTLKKMGIL